MGYVKAAIWVALALGVSCLLGWGLDRFTPFQGASVRLMLNVFGTVILAIMGVGRLGWAIQTWEGQSSAEIWNRRFFVVGSLIGLLFVLTARALEWFGRNPQR